MIYIERTIIINKNEATIEEPIVLYRGDKNIEIQFTIENNPFKYKAGTAITYGQLVIIRPNAAAIIPEPAKLSNGRVLFTIEDGMIDEDIEEGAYDFQIRMINADQTSRGTLPPVTGGIIIKKPICEEATVGTTYVNDRNAIVMPGNDMATYSMRNADNIFDVNGDYNRTNWFGGDIITDTRLNKIEEALYEINNNVPNDYATEEYVDNQRRQTETYAERYTDNAISRINLDSYATTTYVDNQRLQTEAAAERYTDNAIGRLNLDNYATHSYVDSEITKLDINKYATQEYVDDAVSNVSGGGGNVDLTGYATEAYVNNKVTEHALEVKAAGYAAKSDIEENYATKQYTTDYVSEALGKYATKSYVDKAVANIEGGGSGGSNLDIMVIGDDDPNESYYFTGKEFTKDDYNNRMCKSVLMRNRVIIKAFDEFGNEFRQIYNNELVYVQLRNNDRREIYIHSPRGRQDSFYLTEDGALMFIDSSSYATYTAIDIALENQIGNINAILDSINGEEI